MEGAPDKLWEGLIMSALIQMIQEVGWQFLRGPEGSCKVLNRAHEGSKTLAGCKGLRGTLETTPAVTWPDNGMSKKQTVRDEVPAEADTDPLGGKQRVRDKEVWAGKHDTRPTIGAHASS
ncbi:hypothetical protein E2C01_043919 [Portunus trituberculatus]|uniref:Uncharacterized protein n=1 Tax=Portunus trituberculatus TaxID=210409 RepID=A0A5B7FXF1_PORTR|nr:hypothetical protein [Portunus trituberculatus]